MSANGKLPQHTRKQFTHTRAHLTQPVENSIQNDEERQDLHDGKDRAADDKSEDRPQDESDSHRLSPADFVHQESAENAAREIERVDGGAETDRLNQFAFWVQPRDYCGAEDAERIDLCRIGGQHD